MPKRTDIHSLRAVALVSVLALLSPSVARADEHAMRQQTTGAVLTSIGGLHLMAAILVIEIDVHGSFHPCSFADGGGFGPCGDGSGAIGLLGLIVGMPFLAVGAIVTAAGVSLLFVGHANNRHPSPVIVGPRGVGLRF